MDNPIPNNTREAIERFEPNTQTTLLAMRELALEVATENDQIGPLTETLKWGEPAYLTDKTKSGSTLRLAETRADKKPALFVNCRTDLIDQCKEHYGDLFEYDGTRAIIVPQLNSTNKDAVKHCICLVLTYHLRKKH